jgi:hypothetical protein
VDKYRVNPDFVVPAPTAATFFCTVSEEEFTDEFRVGFMDEWRRLGVKQMRVTLVNDEYPQSGYPHGVWLEGWADESATMLPFGESEEPGGPIYPPLTVKE